jgi:hypothetical protein
MNVLGMQMTKRYVFVGLGSETVSNQVNTKRPKFEDRGICLSERYQGSPEPYSNRLEAFLAFMTRRC